MAVFYGLASIVLQTMIWLPQYETFIAFSFQYGTLLALIPIILYNGNHGVVQSVYKRQCFYFFYPIHIVVLFLIRHLLGGE